MKNDTITLRQLADPTFIAPANVAINVSLNAKKASAFSLPPFLFYALKAQQVLKWKYTSEQEALDNNQNANQFTVTFLRSMARKHHADVKLGSTTIDHDRRTKKDSSKGSATLMSAFMQALSLHLIINTDGHVASLGDDWQGGAVSMHVIRIPKNVTVPSFLMSYLENLLGSPKAARYFSYDKTVEIFNRLTTEDAFDKNQPDKKGIYTVLKPPYSESSWARKLHNALYAAIIEINTCNDNGILRNILDVPLIRERDMEYPFTLAGKEDAKIKKEKKQKKQ
jgi:hypothetical protein